MFVIGPDAGMFNTRRLNRQRLLEAIRRLGPISRAELAKRTRLSPPTVSALVEELVAEEGLAVLDPQIVVLGGGLSHAGHLLLEPLTRVVSRIVPNVPCLAISALGDDAQLMGSLYSAMEIADARLLAIAARPAQGDRAAAAGARAGRAAVAPRRVKHAHR